MSKDSTSTTISFRISAALAEELQQRAAAAHLPSVHHLCRDLLLSSLSGITIQEEVAHLEQGLKDIADEIVELRDDVHLLIVKLLGVLADLSIDEASLLLAQSEVTELDTTEENS